MSTIDFIEMTILLCLICFSIYGKMQGFVDECVFFLCVYVCCTQKFKMAAKMVGKRFLGKVTSTICRYPGGQKFRRNRFISHRFQDKSAFAFDAEVQLTAKNGGKTIFGEKLPSDSADTLWVKNFVKITHLAPFPRYGGKTILGKNSGIESADTLQVCKQ